MQMVAPGKIEVSGNFKVIQCAVHRSSLLSRSLVGWYSVICVSAYSGILIVLLLICAILDYFSCVIRVKTSLPFPRHKLVRGIKLYTTRLRVTRPDRIITSFICHMTSGKGWRSKPWQDIVKVSCTKPAQCQITNFLFRNVT